MAFTILTAGSFTQGATATSQKISLPSGCDYFETYNVTQMAATNPNTVIKGQWFGSKFGTGASAAGGGMKVVKTTADLTDDFAAGNGFTYVTTVPQIEAQNAAAITAITAASPAVVSQTSHGYSAGDIIQFYGTTGMLQISGMNFQISTVNANDYTLLGLPAVGFAAAATAGYTRRISKYLAVDPQFLYVTAISKATSAVVTCSVDPSLYYVVGMKVHFSVPYSFGMTEMNQQTGTITAIDSATYQMTVDIDSTAFTTFAFPASTSSPTAQLFATVSPAGAKTTIDQNTGVTTGYDFQYQPFRTGQFTPYMFLASGAQAAAGAASDTVNWIAYKFEN